MINPMLKTKPTTSTKRTMSTQATTKRPAGRTRTERDLVASLAENQEKILAELAAIRAVMTALTKLADLVTDLAPTARGSIGKKPRSLIPNAATVRAMEAARRGELSGPFNSVEELLADLHADD
jgi:hypothetical protein